MSTEPLDLPQDAVVEPSPPSPMTRTPRAASLLVGLAASGGAVVAVFRSGNELGTATLLAAGVYFVLASLLGRFPKLKFGDNEIDPSEVAQARKESSQAKSDSGEAKEGLGDTLERLARLEAEMGRLRSAGQRSADVDDRGREGVRPSEVPGVQPRSDLDPQLAELAQRYNEIRWTMPSGNPRTSAMTGVMTEMIALCRKVQVTDVDALLNGEDRGLRLVAVAYLNARPDKNRIPQLVRASTTEDKPFNEFWALQTLRKTLHDNCDQLTPDLRLKLQERMQALPRGIDRWRLIGAVLNDCP